MYPKAVEAVLKHRSSLLKLASQDKLNYFLLSSTLYEKKLLPKKKHIEIRDGRPTNIERVDVLLEWVEDLVHNQEFLEALVDGIKKSNYAQLALRLQEDAKGATEEVNVNTSPCTASEAEVKIEENLEMEAEGSSDPEVSKSFRFATCCGTRQEEQSYRSTLTLLGGTVRSFGNYNETNINEIDAIVTTLWPWSGSDLEFLALAYSADRTLLHPSYVNACLEAGELVEFPRYIWSDRHCKTIFEKSFVRAFAQLKKHREIPLRDLPLDIIFARLLEAVGEALEREEQVSEHKSK